MPFLSRRLQVSMCRVAATIIAILWFTTPSYSNTFTAFGPQNYARSTGDPVTVTNTFSVLNPNTQYTLRVHNGGLADGDFDKVSSTTITVNGVLIVAPNDLNQNVALVEKPVNLQGSNQIQVQVRGQPGGTIVVEIIGVDNDPPIITASASPVANAAGWNNSNVTVTFTCSDATSGVAVCPAPVIVATEGSNQVINGQARDRAGNTATASVSLKIDKTPPSIIATPSPAANGGGWNNSDVTVTYSCGDSLSGVIACPGSARIAAEGPGQSVTATVLDAAGNSASANTSVNIDKTPPVVTITSPASGTISNVGSVAVTGTVSEALSGLSAVSCNGTPAVRSGASFTCSLSLAPGTNSVQVQALDTAGNAGVATTSVIFRNVPQISITSPTTSTLFSQSPVNVTGTVQDGQAQVTINGITAPVSGTTFLATVPLQEGTDTITAVSQNSNGTTSTASVQVTLDTTPPHVAIYSPPDNFVTSDSSITVTGLVNDIVVGTVNPQQATVTVNGASAEVANRSFTATTIPLVVGPNTIRATGVDRAGNAATVTITVVRQAAGRPVVRAFSGNNQSGPIGTVLSQPLVAQVLNAAGLPVPNTPVIFRVTAQDGTLGTSSGGGLSDIAVNTDAQGLARAVFTLGTHAGAGNNLVEASSTGIITTGLFSESAASTGAALINVDSGNNQPGAIGQPLPLPFIAVVTDSGHNRIPNVPVTFTVKQGGGNIGGQSSTTVNSDGDGRVQASLTVGTGEGINNNLVEATFPGNTGFTAAFTATARVPGPSAATAISGVVLDNSNQPIPGVTMRLFQLNQGPSGNLPTQIGTPVQTDLQGQFMIQPAPVGVFKLMADGGTAQREGIWPTIEYDMVTISGQNNTVGSPIYLPQLNPANRVCVTATTGGTLTMAQVPGFSLKIAPGSATFPGGARAGCVTVTPVNMDKVPMVPGFGQQPRFVVTIQPVGTTFNPPAAITLPNVDGLAPRAVTEMYSYDHDLASFVAIGSATVSDDGSLIRSDPGVGVLKAGWHCGGNPNTTGSAGTCPTCQKCSGSNCVADDSQTPPEKCKECKNGSPVDKEVGSWKDDLTLSASASLPDVLKNGLQNAINKIPGVHAEIEELKLGVSGRAKDCCDPASGNTVTNGKKEATASITASIKNLDIQLWPQPPTMLDKTFSVSAFGEIAEVRILFLAGVFLKSNLEFGAEGGVRTDACGSENCGFGDITANADIALVAEISAQGCFDSTLTGKFCSPTIDASIAPLSLDIEGKLGYNVTKCDEGLSGFVKVLGVKAKIEFKVPLLPTLSAEYEIFGGFCAIGTCE